MPFCTNCGTGVDAASAFCYRCGAPQPRSSTQFTDFLGGLSNRTASILCYVPVIGVIPAIIFLASARYRTNLHIRFDAFQSLYLFVFWLIVSSAVPTLVFTGAHDWGAGAALVGLCKIAVIVCWIYLLIKAAHEQQVRIPIIGDLAARSTTEQL